MGENKYIGKWTETKANRIDMPFTIENLYMLLYRVISKDGLVFSQQDFVNWCEDFYWNSDDNDNTNGNNIEILKETLNDIFTQWELYLVNTYSLEDLQELDFTNIELPIDWYVNWLNTIRSSYKQEFNS